MKHVTERTMLTCHLPACFGSLKEFLDFAPCPPPVVTYSAFEMYALNQSLLEEEICSIAFRCNLHRKQNCLFDPVPSTEVHSAGCNETCVTILAVVVPVLVVITFIVVLVVRCRKMTVSQACVNGVFSDGSGKRTSSCSNALSDRTEHGTDRVAANRFTNGAFNGEMRSDNYNQ